MEQIWLDALRTALIFGHLLAFGIAVTIVLSEDWQFIVYQRVNMKRLQKCHSVLIIALLGLATTGTAIIGIDTGFEWDAIAASDKLLAKLNVVFVLIINGFLLNTIAIPSLKNPPPNTKIVAMLLCLFGAVSTVSWLYAGFLGIAKDLTVTLGYRGFITLYLIGLGSAVGLALLIFRQRVEQLIVREKSLHYT